MTAVAGTLLTVSQFNVHVRDNLLETAASRAMNPSWLWFADGPNRSSEHQIEDGVVETQESTTSESYTDLTTHGPAVNVACNDHILIMMNCQLGNSAANFSCASYEIASELEGGFLSEANNGRALLQDGGAGRRNRYGTVQTFRGLNGPGRYRITMKYRVSNSASTGTFEKRRLQIMPL
jgi:hypothetical protein